MAQPKGTKRPNPYKFNLPPRRCKFLGCTNTFIPKNSNQHYCESDHFLECAYCGSKFLVPRCRLSQPPETCSKTCGHRLAGTRNAWTEERYQKVQATNLAKRNVPYPMMSESVKSRSRATCKERWNADNPMKNPEVVSKLSESVYKKYHVQFSCQLPQCNLGHRSVSKANLAFQKLLEASGIPVSLEFSIGRYRYDFHVPGTNVLIELNPSVTHNTYLNPWGKSNSFRLSFE